MEKNNKEYPKEVTNASGNRVVVHSSAEEAIAVGKKPTKKK